MCNLIKMEENEYRIELRKVLDDYSTDAVKKLNSAFQALPEKTQRVELMIFPDQDGEGTFGVRISLTGPDLYVLNKAIDESAEIIDVKHTPTGLEPNVPMMDTFDSNFEVNDALSDVVGDWLASIWSQVNSGNIILPITIIADEGYGLNLPIKLK
jgi:hypothetical protein